LKFQAIFSLSRDTISMQKLPAKNLLVDSGLWVLGLSPAVAAFLIIYFYGVNVHWGDEWDPYWSGLLIKLHTHQLVMTDLVALHNSHRFLVPRLLLLALYPLIHWNATAWLYFQWIFSGAASVVLWAMIRRSTQAQIASARTEESRAFRRAVFLWFLCNLLFFSPAQYENWLGDMGLGNQIAAYLALLAFLIIGSSWRPGPKLATLVIVVAAASFSQGDGVFLWPICGVLLWWSPSGKKLPFRKALLAIWTAAALLTVILYFAHYTAPAYGAEDKSDNPWAILTYAMTFLGSPFAPISLARQTVIAGAAGSVMFAMYLAAAGFFLYRWRTGRRELLNGALIWFAVGGYALMCAFVAGHFRAGFGLAEACCSRYITRAMFLPIALINLTPMIAGELISRPRANALRRYPWPFGLAGALVLLFLLTIPASVGESATYHMNLRRGKGAFLLLDIFPDDSRLTDYVFKRPAELIQQANALDQFGDIQPPLIRSRVAEQIEQTDPNRKGDFSGKLDSTSHDYDGRPALLGWAIDNRTKHMVDSVFITIADVKGQSIIFAPARLNVNRDDLVPTMGDAYRWTGWIAPISPDDLPPKGDVLFRAWALDAETGIAYPLDGECLVRR
jgi:hypothetical protein